MVVELICVGTELLLGNIVNTNAAYLSEKCALLGLSMYHQSVVGDNAERLKESLETALNRSDVVILSGGLGPTQDDLTKETAAEVMGIPLKEDPHSRERIEEYFKNSQYKVITDNRLPNGNIFASRYIFVVGEGETKTVKLEKYHADLADMLDNFTLDEFKVSDENGNTVKGSELTKNPAVLMWLEQGKEPTEHILNEMLEQEADFQNLPADIIFMVKDKAALENAKLTKVLSTFPRIRVLYDTFVPNVETLARRMYVDPEKLPLIIVTTKELNAVYACSGYNVGSGDMLVKICRNFAGK